MANSKVVKQAAKKYAICFAPSEYVAQGPAKSFGWWAELFVMLNYLNKTAAVPFITDFFDLQSPIKGIGTNPITDGPVALFKFLCRHHPPLAKLGDEWNLNFLAGKSAVPDILTAKPTRHDYYEVKPASDSGKTAGKIKLGKLVALFNDLTMGVASLQSRHILHAKARRRCRHHPGSAAHRHLLGQETRHSKRESDAQIPARRRERRPDPLSDLPGDRVGSRDRTRTSSRTFRDGTHCTASTVSRRTCNPRTPMRPCHSRSRLLTKRSPG